MGVILSIVDQNFPPKSGWTIDQIPDLSSKVIIVTGGSSGLGYETAKVLLQRNAKVYLACRDQQKTAYVIRRLERETQKTALFLQVDLASLTSIKKAAGEFQKIEPALHVLYNNAGVMAPPMSYFTEDSYDYQFGVNVLGHFYLTNLLLSALKAGARSSDDHVARVINVSSQSHILANIDSDTMREGIGRKKATPNSLYGQSKFGNVVFSNELAKRYGPDGIMSLALHPGSLTTDLGRHISPLVRWIIHSVSQSPSEGAITQLWAGTSTEATELNGKYLIPRPRVGLPAKRTLEPAVGQTLWKWMEEQVEGK